MQKIAPFLWFDGKAEEAAEFYVSIFKNSKIVGKRTSSRSSSTAKTSAPSTAGRSSPSRRPYRSP